MKAEVFALGLEQERATTRPLQDRAGYFVIFLALMLTVFIAPRSHATQLSVDDTGSRCGLSGDSGFVMPGEFILNTASFDAATAQRIYGALNQLLEPDREVFIYWDAGMILLKPMRGSVDGFASLAVVIEAIAEIVEVHSLQPNFVWRKIQSSEGRISSLNAGWALDHLNAHVAQWRAERFGDSRQFLIAVVDSGLDLQHDDLRDFDGVDSRLWKSRSGSHGVSFITDSYLPGLDIDDVHGHGTLVAGVIAGRGGGGRPIGVSVDTKIMTVRVFDSERKSTSARVARGVRFAVDHAADIINLSLSTGCDEDQAVRKSINHALAEKRAVVAAAGNDVVRGRDLDADQIFPAAMGSGPLIAVGATDERDQRTRTSRFGKKTVDLGAPGVEIIGPWRINDTHSANGTSFAAPFVSGALALVGKLTPGWSWQDRAVYLNASARTPDAPTTVPQEFSSSGILDLDRATRAPMEVTEPSSSDTWVAGEKRTIHWSPWSQVGPCAAIDAWYSGNGGQDFDENLASRAGGFDVLTAKAEIKVPKAREGAAIDDALSQIRLNCRGTHLYAYSAFFRVR